MDTSFGEASSRTQATDPNRRETLRIRTPPPDLRVEAKWLRRRTGSDRPRATPWSAKALTSWGVPDTAAADWGPGSVCPLPLRRATRHNRREASNSGLQS